LGRIEPSQLYEIEEERVGVPVKGGLYEVDLFSLFIGTEKTDVSAIGLHVKGAWIGYHFAKMLLNN